MKLNYKQAITASVQDHSKSSYFRKKLGGGGGVMGSHMKLAYQVGKSHAKLN